MYFAPQWRVLFRRLNFQKWSGGGVFCIFWCQNVLRTITAWIFSTSELLKVVREWCVLYILTSKCVSRHNGVQIFISHLASWFRTRRFSEPTFRPSGATNHWKNTLFRDFPTFSTYLHLLSSDSFSSDLLSSNLSLLSASALLCFSSVPSVHIVGRLTSKLLSITSEPPKVARTCSVLYILTWKCSSRHNGVYFFRHLNFQKWSGADVFCTFWHGNMPTLFRRLNFQKWSENGVFYTFWLQNVFRATTACKFSSLIWPADSAPAALASLLFDPPEPQIIGKTHCFATFLPFHASASSFFWLFLFWSSLF